MKEEIQEIGFDLIDSSPLEICEVESKTTFDLLPALTRERYIATYDTFIEWKTVKNLESFSEEVLLIYFEELGAKYKSSTLWAVYSMLKSIIIMRNNIDISRYLKVRAFLKAKAENYVPKKSKILTPEDFNRFLNEAPDKVYLLTKAVVVVGLAGACRRDELVQLRIDDMQDLNSVILIQLKSGHKKIPRSFVLTGNFYDICKKYASLRPSNYSEKRFFLNYRNGKCTRQVVGINKIGGMAKEVATYLNLENPEMYTGHCFRRSSATLLINAGGDLLSLKRPRPSLPRPEVIDEGSFLPRPAVVDEGSFLPRPAVVDEGTDDSVSDEAHTPLKIIKTEVVTDEETSECRTREEIILSELGPTSTASISNVTNVSTINLYKKNTPGIYFENCSNITINYYVTK